MARWLQRRMVFLIGTTEEEIKQQLDRSQDEIEKFDEWIRDNGGTLEYGLSNKDGPIQLEDLEGAVVDDWEVGLPPKQKSPRQSSGQVPEEANLRTVDLLRILDQNDDLENLNNE